MIVADSNDRNIVLTDADARAPAPGDAIRDQLEADRHEIVAKLISLAKAGDGRSIETALKWLAPTAKQDAERIYVAGLREAPTVKDKSLAILNAVSRGEISVEAGEKVQRMLALHTQAVTITDMAEQIEALKAGRVLPLPLAQRVDRLDDFSDIA